MMGTTMPRKWLIFLAVSIQYYVCEMCDGPPSTGRKDRGTYTGRQLVPHCAQLRAVKTICCEIEKDSKFTLTE